MASIKTASEIREISQLTAILAEGLIRGADTVEGVPPEVALGLEQARQQLQDLPAVLQHLRGSLASYQSVSAALYRMMELADLGADENVEYAQRESWNKEFINLSKIVAADAGRRHYSGPRLNLLNQGEALSARRILSYMKPVIENTGQELEAQKELIREVVTETVNFLRIVADCYPEAEGTAGLREIIAETDSQSAVGPGSYNESFH